MGAASSSPSTPSSRGPVTSENGYRAVVLARARSQNIHRLLKIADKAESDAIHVVVLGRAGSGKSTFLRQVRALFADVDGAPGDVFSPAERARARALMLGVALRTVQAVLRVADARGFAFDGAAADADAVRAAPEGGLTAALLPALRRVWRGEHAMERAWDLRSSLALSSNAAFFVRRADEAVAPGFRPTIDDLVRLYFPSTGVVATVAALPAGRSATAKFAFYDVGSTGVSGTASRYKRMSDLFLNARAVVYTVSLADYDVTLPRAAGAPRGAPRVNKLAAAVGDFARFLASADWKRCLVALLLTHRDEFAEKLRTIGLRHEADRDTAPRFLDYFGGTSLPAAKAHVARAFEEVAARAGRSAGTDPPVLVLDIDLLDSSSVGVAVLAITEALIPFDEREKTRSDIKQRVDLEAGLRDELD